MFTVKSRSLLSALLCASALFAFACGGRERAARDGEVSEPQAATQEIPDNELRPAPRSVDVQEETVEPPAASDEAETARAAEVEERERALRAREAELAARERVLQREQERREQQARQAPRPAPAPREEAPAPAAEVPVAEAEEIEPAPVPEPEPAAEPEPEEETEVEVREEPRAEPVDVPAGTAFDVEFLDTIGSASSRTGDLFRVRVSRDVYLNGDVVIPGGSEIVGTVTEAAPPGRVGGRAKLGLRFTDLVLPSGSTVPIDASLVQEGRSETGRDAAAIGGGAAAGAVLGRILNKKDRGKGSVIGAILGAAAGAVIASRTAGEEVTIPEGAVVSVKLDGPVEIRPRE